MKILTLFILPLLAFSPPAFAEMDHSNHPEMKVESGSEVESLAKAGDAQVSVNGLVCDFCARALEKTFSKKDEVSGIDVNLETKIVTIYFNDEKTLNDEALTQIITDSGYNVESIQRVE